MRPTRSLNRIPLIVFAALLLFTAIVHAQFGRGFGANTRMARPDDFDGRFHYCRVFYRSGFDGAGGSWTTDFPRADINFSIRLSELTHTRVSRGANGDPNHLIVRLTSDELFQCPLVI